jgi:RimJ/RimL family protein N-acetyltransferase
VIVPHTNPRLAPWMLARMPHGRLPGDAVLVGWESHGRIVACVAYDNFNGASISMHVVGEGKRWLTRDYLRFCFAYPFEQLRVKKVLGLVPSTNADAIKFDEHLGFVREAVIADAVPGGDLIVYSMTRDQCRHLEQSYGHGKIQSAA